MKKYLSAIAVLVFIGLGIYIGYLIFSTKSPANSNVSSESIVSMLQEEGFLVTQTYIVNQQVKIDNKTGRIIKDFFWRQEIWAFGTLKVSSGVDLTQIKEEDIVVGSNNVQINLPPVEAKSVELIGDLTLQNNQGILKRIFDNDDGYNTAFNTLRGQAVSTASSSTLYSEAQSSTKRAVERLVRLAAPNRAVEVNFK